MRKLFSDFKKLWLGFAFAVGDIMSSIFLTVFYYSFFALFALPYRVFAGGFVSPRDSTWIKKSRNEDNLKSLENEF